MEQLLGTGSISNRCQNKSIIIQTQGLLTVSLAFSLLECWDEESTASTLRALAVRLQSTGLSLRETAAILADPPTASPSQVTVD